MKIGVVVALLLLFAGTLYFIVFPDTKLVKAPQKASISNDNPFFTPRNVTLPFGEDGIEHGQKLVAQKNYDDAVSALGTFVTTDVPQDRKELATRMAGLALMQKNDDDAKRHAREVFEAYLEAFPGSKHADSAHFYLGTLAAEEKDAPTALAHFTTITADFPESGFATNAAVYSKNLAGMLEKQDDAFKGRVLRVIGPLIPRNPAAFLGYLVTILGWLVYDWKKVAEKLFKEKHPMAWLVLILSIVLLGINYSSEWRHSSSLISLTTVLQTPKR